MPARRREFTPEQQAALDELVRNGGGCRRAAHLLGVPDASHYVAESRRRQGLAPINDPQRSANASGDITTAQISAAYRRAVEAKAAHNIFLHRQIHDWTPPVDGPIGVAFMGDVHLGSAYVDYPQEARDRQLIRETEGLYCVAGGDGIDNPIKHVSMMVAASMNATEQWRWLGDWVSDLADKLVAIIGGNHEEWTVAATGFDPLMEIVKRLGPTPVDPARIRLNLRVGSQCYRTFVTHKSRMNSTFNAAHSVKQLHRLNEVFDVGVACDRHTFALEPWISNTGLMTWCARPGSYQVTSGFARGKGFADALPASPVIIFWPEQRRMWGFTSVEDGAYALRLVREDWKHERETAARKRHRPSAAIGEGRRRERGGEVRGADRHDPRTPRKEDRRDRPRRRKSRKDAGR